MSAVTAEQEGEGFPLFTMAVLGFCIQTWLDFGDHLSLRYGSRGRIKPGQVWGLLMMLGLEVKIEWGE